jgi:hypothetical protein
MKVSVRQQDIRDDKHRHDDKQSPFAVALARQTEMPWVVSGDVVSCLQTNQRFVLTGAALDMERHWRRGDGAWVGEFTLRRKS